MIIKSSFPCRILFFSVLSFLLFSCNEKYDNISPEDKKKLDLIKSLDSKDLELISKNRGSIAGFKNYLKSQIDSMPLNSKKTMMPMGLLETRNELTNKLPITSTIHDFKEIERNIVLLRDSFGFDDNFKLQIYHTKTSFTMAARMLELYKKDISELGLNLEIADLVDQESSVIRILHNNRWIKDNDDEYHCDSCGNNGSGNVRTIFNVGRLCPKICPGGSGDWNDLNYWKDENIKNIMSSER